MKRGKLLVYFSGVACDELALGRIAAYALLTSYGVRRGVKLVIDTICRGVNTRIVIDGARVKHLRMDEDSLRGFIRRALTRGMPGVSVVKPTIIKARICISLMNIPDSLTDACQPLPCPLRRLDAIHLGVDRGLLDCVHVIEFKPRIDMDVWLIAPILLQLLDRWCIGGLRGACDSQGRLDSREGFRDSREESVV